MKVRLTLGLMLATLALPAQAALQLYPLRGVFFPEGGAESLIHADFRRALGAAELGYFEQRFRAAFPDAAKRLDERNRRRTFAVSLQVARASFYRVPKIDKTVDAYFPVTLSIYFTNVMTGEVLYAATRTDILTTSLTPVEAQEGRPRVVELFRQNFRSGVDRIVEDAQRRFVPRVISATVREHWNDLALLDGGVEEGVIEGDTLLGERGDELRVVSAGAHYAVARLELGRAEKGARFSKVTARTVSDLKKPRVLPLTDEAPRDLPAETISQLFSDALGEAGPVSLVPVNRTFQQVLNAVAAQTDLSQEALRKREWPDLFVRLHVPEPIVFVVPTNLAYATRRITDARAFAEVVDRSGRVLFAARGRSRVEDEITAGMTFDVAARREIAVKNALIDLAQRFEKEFRLERARLEVADAADPIVIRDAHGALATGSNLRAYHRLGRVRGIEGDVEVPVWELAVLSVEEGRARAKATLPIVKGAPALERGDVVLVDEAGGSRAARVRLGACGAPENAGQLELPAFESLAMNQFAAGYRAPFFLGGLAARVGELVRGGAGFRSDLAFEEPIVDYCVQGAYRVQPSEPACDDELCADVADVAVSYRLHRGGARGELKSKHALQVKVTAVGLPRSTPEEARRAALAADSLEQISKLAPAVAGAFTQEKM